MISAGHRYFVIHKPINMVSQFVSRDNVGLLGDLGFIFPEGTHAIGRLDSNSEGLLILTTNKKVTRLLFQGEKPHIRTYLVQVNYHISDESLERLRKGVKIRIKGGGFYITAPAEVEKVSHPGIYLQNDYMDNLQIPSSWVLISMKEGKYHQVRKMITAAGHRCKRLIRVSIEGLQLQAMPAGSVRELDERSFFELLKIKNW